MASTSRRLIHWGKYKLNPAITLNVESDIEQNDNPKGNHEIGLSPTTRDSNHDDHNHVVLGTPSDGIATENHMHPYKIKVPRLLPKHFKFMYYVGIFPHKYDGEAVSLPKFILQQVNPKTS